MITKFGLVFLKIVERHPFLFFIFLSLIFSGWATYADSIMNNDGILYLSAASLFAEGQWNEATLIYKWPTYSILIAGIIIITGFEPFYAAQVLNSALDAGTVAIFIAIVRLMGASRRGLLAAGVMIVGHLWINDMRSTIIRDHGYLTLYLLAIYFLLKDRLTPEYKTKLACVASLLCASLFRIEGLIFTASILVYYGWIHAGTKIQKLLLVFSVLILTFLFPIAAVLWKTGFPNSIFFALIEFRFDELIELFHEYQFSDVAGRVDSLRENVLPSFAQGYAGIAYAGIAITFTVFAIIKSVTLLYGPMACYALYKNHIVPNKTLIGRLIWMSVINIGILFLFVCLNLFFDWRYGVALSLTLALLGTFSYIEAYRVWWNAPPKDRRRYILLPVTLTVLILALAIDGLPSPTKYRHVKYAALWVQENIQNQSLLASNSRIFMYYAGRWKGVMTPLLRNNIDASTQYWTSPKPAVAGPLGGFDYIVVDVRRHGPRTDQIIRDNLDVRTLKEFKNYRGERIIIFQVKKMPALENGPG